MNQVAPEGQVFVCAACGKQSQDRYGFKRISQGWDESCMLHAVLCYEKQPGETQWRAVWREEKET